LCQIISAAARLRPTTTRAAVCYKTLHTLVGLLNHSATGTVNLRCSAQEGTFNYTTLFANYGRQKKRERVKTKQTMQVITKISLIVTYTLDFQKNYSKKNNKK